MINKGNCKMGKVRQLHPCDEAHHCWNIQHTVHWAPLLVLVQHLVKLLGPLHMHSDGMNVLRCPRPLGTKVLALGKL